MEQNYITHAPGTSEKIEKLLNWDHDLYPTSLEDLLESIKCHVARHSGYIKLQVAIDKNGALDIAGQYFRSNNEGRYLWQDLILSVDVNTGREIYGRARHIGFTPMEMYGICKYIREAMAVAKH